MHYLPLGWTGTWIFFPTKNILSIHPIFKKKVYAMPETCLKKVVTLPINLIVYKYNIVNKGNNKITELRTILQRESQNS